MEGMVSEAEPKGLRFETRPAGYIPKGRDPPNGKQVAANLKSKISNQKLLRWQVDVQTFFDAFAELLAFVLINDPLFGGQFLIDPVPGRNEIGF